MAETRDIRDAQWLGDVLRCHGQPDGQQFDCFGTDYSPEDFVYFTVHPDHLSIKLHRILPEVAGFNFQFLLRLTADGVVIERVLTSVEGGNKRIRRALGEAYAKTSIGIPFSDLSEEEEEWIEIALAAFQMGWMRDP